MRHMTTQRPDDTAKMNAVSREIFRSSVGQYSLRPLMLVMALTLTACGEKRGLDRRVEELCEKDGAITVYEPVRLPPPMFDKNNNVKQTAIRKNRRSETIIADAYVETVQIAVLKDGDPLKGQGLLHRQHNQILRLIDGKVLAESVQYIRTGGDGFHLGHHTTKVCPIIDGGLVPRVFTKQ